MAEGPPARARRRPARHQPIFVRLGVHGREAGQLISAQAIHKLVHRDCLAAGVPDRLAHPHALRSYWATHLLEIGVPIHVVKDRLGHADLRTTSVYAASRPESIDDVADLLDRHDQAQRRNCAGR